MLDLRCYSKDELTEIFNSNDRQAIRRKLQRANVVFEEYGNGANWIIDITKINDPFRIYCMTDLGFTGRTDFYKLRYYYYYFFSDEEFMTMPDEVKEQRMRDKGRSISRRTIAGYTRKLEERNMINRNTSNFLYYFAYKQTQRFTDRSEYGKAWSEYWENKNKGLNSWEAIVIMRHRYGGVARRQAIPEVNGIYNKQIEYMLSLIYQSIENEIDTIDFRLVMERLNSTGYLDSSGDNPFPENFNWDIENT